VAVYGKALVSHSITLIIVLIFKEQTFRRAGCTFFLLALLGTGNSPLNLWEWVQMKLQTAFHAPVEHCSVGRVLFYLIPNNRVASVLMRKIVWVVSVW